MHRVVRTLLAFSLIASLCATAPAAAAPESASDASVRSKGGGRARPGEVIVVYEPGVGAPARKLTAARLGGTPSEEVKVERSRAQLVRLRKGMSIDEAIAKYSDMPGVAFVQPNFLYERAAYTATDPAFTDGTQWGLRNLGNFRAGSVTPVVDADIDAELAWDTTIGSPDVVVAVVDSGVDYNHPDLNDNIWANTDEIAANGIDDDKNGYVDDVRGWNFYGAGNNNPMDVDDHGTHVAGIIAAEGNGQGTIGVAPGVKIMPLRFFPASAQSSGSTLDALEAIIYAAENGADVINASWGGEWTKDPDEPEDVLLQHVIEDSGVLLVAAAGNSYNNNDGRLGFWPASSDSPNVLTVAASQRNDQRVPYTNYGRTTVDVFAPGEYILSTKPYASGVWDYQYMSGTSMAAPHVSGAAALVLSANPSLSMRQVRRAILENVDYKTAFNTLCASGGRLNADRAVDAASSVPLVADVNRLSGADRYETAVEIARGSNPSWTGVEHVIIASGEDRSAVDALAAAGLVWAYGDAPLFLTSSTNVPASVREALREIGSANTSVTAHVVGGVNAVPDGRMAQVTYELKQGGATADWYRVSGGTRYETAAEISRTMAQERPGEMPAVALIANGAESSHFADALALSAVSANTGAPILLVGPTWVPQETTDALAALPQPVRTIIGGGTASVSDDVALQLGAERWSGSSRYATAVEVADNAISQGWLGFDEVSVAASLPDALSGANIAAASDGPVLLTQSTVLSTETKAWLTAKSGTVSAGWILGGYNSVSRTVENSVDAALDWQRQ